MAQFKISVDLSGVAGAGAILNQQVLPLLNQAVRAVAAQAQINWMEAVYRAKLWSGEKDAYAASITMQMTGPFSAVVSANYKYAEEIETGRPPRDLKKMLDTSPKVRVSAKGKRYLIIPFRHNTPDNEANAPAMPPDVYALAQELKPSRIVGQTTRQSGLIASNPSTRQRLTVPQNVYNWGGSLPAGLKAKLKETHKTDPYTRMYRFDAKTPSGGRYSTYLTFRVMVEGSPGWIIPAKPGLYLAKKVAEDMQPLAEQAFGEAMKRTLG